MNAAELFESYRPRIAEARERDRRETQLALVACPVRIGSAWIQPMTLRRLMYLEAINHPIITGLNCERGAVVDFLWIMSDDFVPGCERGAKKFRRRFWFRKIEPEKIREHLAGEFADMAAPEGNVDPRWVAQLVDMIAGDYGWSEAEILDVPIRRLMMYADALVARRTEARSVAKSPRADAIKAEYLVRASALAKSERDPA
jgi:hypothetical protein